MGGGRKRRQDIDEAEKEFDERCNKKREGLFQEAHRFLADASTVDSCSLWLQRLLDDYDSYQFSKEEMIMMNRIIDMVKAKVLSLLAALPVDNPHL